MNPLVMPRAECEAMLSDVRIGVLSANGGPDRPPVLGPLWYAYEPGGEVQMNIGAQSHKARAVAADPLVSLCVQDEGDAPRFVTVSGRGLLGPDDPALHRAIAARYLPPDAVEGYLESMAATDMITLRFTPERWLSNDYGRLAP